MEIDEIRIYALSLPDTEECFPFGENSLVFKTKGKIFIILDLISLPATMNYKADPEDIILQREEYPDAIFPGYHMNKKHWNTVRMDGRIPNPLLEALVRHAHALVHPVYRKSAGNFIHLP